LNSCQSEPSTILHGQARLHPLPGGRALRRERGDDRAQDLQRVVVVLGQVVDDAGDARVHVAAAELLRGDLLAGRGLHERRAAEEDRALLAHDHGLVAHRGDVGAAGGA
jgi:hypothetical protein